MIHNVDNIQPETLNLRIHCTIVTGTLLIYNKDTIKKNAIFLVFFFLDLEHPHISKKNWLVYMFTTQAWPLSRHKVTCRGENSLAHQWYSRDTSLGQLWQNRVFELICFPPRQWIRVKWHGFFNFVTGQLWLNYLKQWLPRNKLSYDGKHLQEDHPRQISSPYLVGKCGGGSLVRRTVVSLRERAHASRILDSAKWAAMAVLA